VIGRSLVMLVGLALLSLGVPRAACAQDSAVRFEITNVADSTFSFTNGNRGWVKRGEHGIAVDPRRRDVVVGRFTVIRVDHTKASALITGQTTVLDTNYVAILTRPSVPWYRQRTFWVGTVIGVLLGAAVTGR
jgi:hypothetical protein